MSFVFWIRIYISAFEFSYSFCVLKLTILLCKIYVYSNFVELEPIKLWLQEVGFQSVLDLTGLKVT